MADQPGGRTQVVIIFSAGEPGSAENAAEFGVLETVDAVAGSLGRCGYVPYKLELFPPVSSAAAKLESLPAKSLVFNLFEGFSDDPFAEVQIGLLLESLGLAYTGCPPLSMHLGLDKSVAKAILGSAGLPVAKGKRVVQMSDIAAIDWTFPLFIKPNSSDASHGIGPGNKIDDLKALEEESAGLLSRFAGGIIVEAFLGGREFNCSVIGKGERIEALPPSMVDYSALPADHPPVLTFSAKWEPENASFQATPTKCPAPVEPPLLSEVQRLAKAAFVAAGCRGYARVDLREDDRGGLYILELNPNPDLAPSAGLAKQARAAGWDYDALVTRILGIALS